MKQTNKTKIKLGQVWRCHNNKIVKVVTDLDEENPYLWCWGVQELRKSEEPNGYNVTGYGKFWEPEDSLDEEDEPDDLKTLLSPEEFPEYYL